MNKIILGIALLCIAGIFAWVVWGANKDPKVVAPEITESEPTTFSESGVFTYTAGQSQDSYLVYGASGTSTRQAVLAFDVMSICVTAQGGLPCLMMSVPVEQVLAGKNVVVEGIAQGTSTVLVRKLSELREGELPRLPSPGSVFISWADAVKLIEACQPTMIMQTHALDVYLNFEGGERLRAVEPMIDEVFRVIDRTREVCGEIPVATE